jgi:DNA-binding response OmpR family regulator
MQPENNASVLPYHDAHLKFDFDRHAVTVDTQQLTLTRKEYELFELLVKNAGEIVPRHALLMRVWGYRSDIKTRTLDVHIRRLRKKLGAYAEHYIETVFGVGYRFQPYRIPRFFVTAAPDNFAIGA